MILLKFDETKPYRTKRVLALCFENLPDLLRYVFQESPYFGSVYSGNSNRNFFTQLFCVVYSGNSKRNIFTQFFFIA